MPQAHYRFKHALVQEAAYTSLLRRRRQTMHHQVAQVLNTHFPHTVETQPEVLAYHYTEAGRLEQAIPYWQRSAQRAIEHSANREALRYLTTALEMLQTLPDNAERQLRELALQMLLGPVVMATHGYAAPEVQQVYARAHHLCQQLGDIPQLFPALWGLWRFYLNRARLAEAGKVSEHLFTLAQRLQDSGLRMQAHIALGVTRTDLGEFAIARDHLDSALALYDASRHRSLSRLYGGLDPGVHCLAFVAHVFWRLGFPEQALARSREALALARQLAHPNTLAYTLMSAGVVHAQRREAEQVQVLMDEQMALATEHGFALLLAASTIMRGWALSEQGQVEAGVAQLRAGLAAHIATGAELTLPYWYRLLAEAYRTQCDVREGLAVLAEVLARIERTGERHVEVEAYRLKGELLLLQAGPEVSQAAVCFHHALDIARRQQAKSLELRVAMSLARLWQQQDKRQEAYDLLAPVYDWFTEGFDTADLQDAKNLLEEFQP